MNPPDKIHGPLAVLPVVQRGGTFYVSSFRASQLCELCSGLRASPLRETSPESVGIAGNDDAAKLVKSLSESAFAQEVISAQSEPYDVEDPYQRLLDRSRARAIARYLQQEDAILPNAVILAVREEVEVEASEDGKQITLKWNPALVEEPFNIIDGQHRIEGLKILMDERPGEYEEFAVPVTLLLDLPFFAQAELFATINGEQKKVNRSQIYDLLGYKPITNLKVKQLAYLGELAVQRFCHHAVKVLNTSTKSPWCGRIKMRGSGRGIVTQAALVDHLAAYLIAKKERVEMRYLPVLYPFLKDSDLLGLARVLVIYFVGVSRAKQEFWREDEALKNSLFGKTNGIAVLFAVFHDLVCYAGGTQNLTVEGVASLWSKVPNEVVAVPPPGGSKGYQVQVTEKVLSAMFGNEYDKLLRDKMETVKNRLRDAGGLLAAKP